MKKLLSVFTAFAMLFCLASCGGETSNDESPSAEQPSGTAEVQQQEAASDTQEQTSDGSELVVYFSATGNTRSVAEALADMRGAELYEIVPEQPYTSEDLDYSNDSCRANTEQNDDSARPAISGSIGNIDQYDTIFVGFPIWWGTMPRIMYTFFEAYDMSGKTIAPFCTSGGSGISAAVEEITGLEPFAAVTEGLQLGSSDVTEPTGELTEWLGSIGI